MANKASHRELAEFIAVLDSAERWLDVSVGQTPLAPGVRKLAGSLRRYIKHCRRVAWRGELSSPELQRQRDKVNLVGYRLWEAAMGQKP